MALNSLIDEVKKEYAIPVYNLQNFYNLDDSELQFTISNNNFLEMLLLRIRGETIKYASAKKHRENFEEKKLKKTLKHLKISPVTSAILKIRILKN